MKIKNIQTLTELEDSTIAPFEKSLEIVVCTGEQKYHIQADKEGGLEIRCVEGKQTVGTHQQAQNYVRVFPLER